MASSMPGAGLAPAMPPDAVAALLGELGASERGHHD